jgi:hypothetical protein
MIIRDSGVFTGQLERYVGEKIMSLSHFILDNKQADVVNALSFAPQ